MQKKYVKKEVYDEIIRKLNSQMLEDEFYDLGELNPVLLSLFGTKTYRIWRNSDEKKIVLENMYRMWKENNYDMTIIINSFGISKKDVCGLLKMYATLYLGITEDEWKRHKLEVDIMEKHGNCTVTSKLVEVYEALIKAENLEEIIDIIDSRGYTTNYLRSHLHDYLIRYNGDNYDEYKALIISKFKMYTRNKQLQTRKEKQEEKEEARRRYVEETLPKAKKLIKMFIESPYVTPEEFFEKEKVNGNTSLPIIDIFNECLNLVKKYSEELYRQYLEKIENGKRMFYNDHISEVLTIISLIKNGIDENSIKRAFDLIDYLQFTSLSLNDLLKIARKLHENKEINAKDYGIIAKFVSNNKKGEVEIEKDIATIYKEERIVNVIRKSETGVSNTIETIQDETKDKLISYLRNNGIPVNYLTYNAALLRYQMGHLILEDFKSY